MLPGSQIATLPVWGWPETQSTAALTVEGRGDGDGGGVQAFKSCCVLGALKQGQDRPRRNQGCPHENQTVQREQLEPQLGAGLKLRIGPGLTCPLDSSCTVRVSCKR